MRTAVLWVDREVAKIYLISKGRVEGLHVVGSQIHEQKSFFEKICAHLKFLDKYVLCGPGIAKYLLKKFLCDHHPAQERKIVAIDTIEIVSDSLAETLCHKHLNSG